MSKVSYPPDHARVGAWAGDAESVINRVAGNWKSSEQEMREVLIKSLHMVEILRQEMTLMEGQINSMASEILSLKTMFTDGHQKVADAVSTITVEVVRCRDGKV